MKIGPVEDGVPIPSATLYPWADMKPGRSFGVVVDKGDDAERIRKRVWNAAKARQRKYGERYYVGRVYADDTDKVVGVRVWRKE